MSRPKTSEMKNKILSSVEILISENGVNDISLADIASACNISKGTLYYHYASKDDIIFDIIVKHIKGLEDEYLSWLNRHKDDLTPDRFLKVVFYKGVKLFNRAKMHIFLINECLRGNQKLTDKFVELWKHWQETLKLGLVNVFPNCQDVETLSYMIMLIIDGLVIQEVLHSNNNDNGEQLVKMVKQMGDSNE